MCVLCLSEWQFASGKVKQGNERRHINVGRLRAINENLALRSVGPAHTYGECIEIEQWAVWGWGDGAVKAICLCASSLA